MNKNKGKKIGLWRRVEKQRLGYLCTTILSLLHSHTQVWSSLIIDTHKILRVYGLGYRIWGLRLRV